MEHPLLESCQSGFPFFFSCCNTTVFRNLESRRIHISYTASFLWLSWASAAQRRLGLKGGSGFLVLITSETLEIQHHSHGGMSVNKWHSERKEIRTSALDGLCRIYAAFYPEILQQVTFITCSDSVVQFEKNKTGNREWFGTSFCPIYQFCSQVPQVTSCGSGFHVSLWRVLK